MLQCDYLVPSPSGLEQWASYAVLTCCRHGQGAERLSRGYCLASCYDTGSGLSAAPLLAAAGSAAAVGVASQRGAGMLQGEIKPDKFILHMDHVGCSIVRRQYVLALQSQCMNPSPHSVICPAVGSVRQCPCPPTLPWPSDPQHGYTLSTCRKTQAHS